MAFGFSESTNDPMNPDGPATIERRRRLAEALIQQGTSGAPIKSWTEGVSNIAKAMMGGYDMRQADAAERDGRKSSNDQTSALVKALMGEPAASSPPVVAPTPSTAMTTADATAKPVAGRDEFIAAITPHAQEVAKQTGMDPRIVIAQAALESGWGRSAPGNNYFGIKSHGARGGQTLATTENVDGQNVATNDSFRTYGDMGESARGYGEFLRSNPRYKPVLEAQGMDAQIAALAKSGYATDPMYGNKIASIARGLQLPQAGAPQQVASAAPLAYAPQATATDAMPTLVGDPRYPSGQAPGEIPPLQRTPFVPAPGMGGPPTAGGGAQAIASALGNPAPASTGVSRATAGFIPEIDQPHTTNPAQIAAGGAAAAPAPRQQLAQALMPPQPQPPAQSAQQQPAATAGPAGDQRALGLAMQIFQNPWADAGQKQIATTILSKQLSAGKVTTVDLGDRVGLMNERGQVQGYLPKQRDAADWEPVKDGSGNMVGRFNKRSGQSEALPNVLGDAAKAPSVQRVKQPDGSEVAVQWDERQKVWLPLNAPGGGNAVQSTLPKLTEGQGKDVGFLQRGLEANKALTPAAEQALMDTADTVAQNFPTIMGVNPAREMFGKLDEAARAFELRAATAQNSKTFARTVTNDTIRDVTEPGALGTLMQGKPIHSSQRLVQALLGTGPQAQVAKQDQIYSRLAQALTGPTGASAEKFAMGLESAYKRRASTERLVRALGDTSAGAVSGGLYQYGGRIAGGR